MKLPPVSLLGNWKKRTPMVAVPGPHHADVLGRLFHVCGATDDGFIEPLSEGPIWFWGSGEEAIAYAGSPAVAGRVYNPPLVSRVLHDKWNAYVAIGGRHMPRTVPGLAAALRLRFPVVVKRRRTHAGIGMSRHGSRVRLLRHLPDRSRRRGEVIYQEAVELVREYRCFAFRGEVLYLCERFARNARAEAIRRGGSATVLPSDEEIAYHLVAVPPHDQPFSPELALIARACWESMPIDVNGLDLALDSRQRLWLLEGNAAPILKCGSMAAVFLAIVRHHWGRVDADVCRYVQALGRELEDEQERLDVAR